MEAQEFKLCKKCNILKSVKEFYKRPELGSNGLVAHCKECLKKRYTKNSQNPTYKERSLKNSKRWQKENPLRTKFLSARSSSLNGNRRRIIDWSLSFEECVSLWKEGCHYCGVALLEKKGSSLDRRDHNLGYTLDNVVPCCGDCNKIRNTILSVEEMEVAMKAILDFRSIKRVN